MEKRGVLVGAGSVLLAGVVVFGGMAFANAQNEPTAVVTPAAVVETVAPVVAPTVVPTPEPTVEAVVTIPEPVPVPAPAAVEPTTESAPPVLREPNGTTYTVDPSVEMDVAKVPGPPPAQDQASDPSVVVSP